NSSGHSSAANRYPHISTQITINTMSLNMWRPVLAVRIKMLVSIACSSLQPFAGLHVGDRRYEENHRRRDKNQIPQLRLRSLHASPHFSSLMDRASKSIRKPRGAESASIGPIPVEHNHLGRTLRPARSNRQNDTPVARLYSSIGRERDIRA